MTVAIIVTPFLQKLYFWKVIWNMEKILKKDIQKSLYYKKQKRKILKCVTINYHITIANINH